MSVALTPRLLLATTALSAVLGLAAPAVAQDAPILQPGAPGQASRPLTAEEATRLSGNRYSDDDVRFMQGMILHHAQAVRMSALVDERTNTQAIRDIADKIEASQADEIRFMRTWLTERGQTAPDPADPHAMHAMHGASPAAGGHTGHTMPGMATEAQMEALAAAQGPAFDRMFLELMIAHHQGALDMVEDLLDRSGSAYEPALFRFVNDIENEQQAEIDRMTALFREGDADPRPALTAGFRDAGQAIRGLTLEASLPKPVGFYDAENPAGLPPPVPPAPPAEGEAATPAQTAAEAEVQFGERGPFLSFANTDLAFRGDLMAVGNYHGFNLYRLGGGQPALISSVVCPGGQGDVSIVGDILIMSVEQSSARVDCGRQGIEEDVSADRFRGLRIFDISDPARPAQVGQVQACRGSHTHSVVSADERSIIVYNSGTAGIRKEEELAGCVGSAPGDDRTALFSIDVIEIPVADPSRARIIDSPRVFAEDGRIAGLWQGGDHGEGTQSTARTDQCHDITVFPSLKLAAGACSGNGIIFDISDPRAPKRIDAVNDPGFAYWHSATFNNDGTKVLFTDEWGGGARPRCRVQDRRDWGADAFYDIVDGKLERRATYKLPAAQSDKENCVAHNGSIIPVPGRDLFVQAWYQGGLSIIDFTDSNAPVEIAYFDRGPIDAEHDILGGYWSTYWYDGKIYGTEIVRGLDVFALAPSDQLTANEIAAAGLADQGGTFNPQQQFPVTWPAHPVVARAYLDQLARSNGLPEATRTEIGQALDAALPVVEAGGRDAAAAARLTGLANVLETTGPEARRLAALKTTLQGVAERIG